MASFVRLKVFLGLCVMLIGLNAWLTFCGAWEFPGNAYADTETDYHCRP
jgi:hypothetical protein